MNADKLVLTRRRLLSSGLSGLLTLPWIAYASQPVVELEIRPSDQSAGSKHYQALVCLFLAGGNDSWNLLLPSGNEGSEVEKHLGYQSYYQQRKGLAVKQTPLDSPKGSIASARDNPYFQNNVLSDSYLKGMYPLQKGWGLNACCPEIAGLWQRNRIAWVANSGNLITPVTRSNFETSRTPPFLFAHNHQQSQLETGDATAHQVTGWAGRMADLWFEQDVQASHMGSILGHTIGIGKRSKILAATRSNQLIIPVGRPPGYTGLKWMPKKRDLLVSLLNQKQADPFQSVYADGLSASFDLVEFLTSQWSLTSAFEQVTGLYGESLFSTPDSGLLGLSLLESRLLKSFDTLTRLIEISKNQGIQKQIFTVRMGGFDTHSNQKERHPLLLRELSLAIGHFQQAMDHLGLSDQVTLFTQSDFSRTLQNNGSGTDHGWGGHQMLVGGAVNPGVHGEFTDLSPDSQSFTPGNRGRVIPNISNDQVLAPLLTWMGLSKTEIHQVLPNLKYWQGEGGSLDLMKSV